MPACTRPRPVCRDAQPADGRQLGRDRRPGHHLRLCRAEITGRTTVAALHLAPALPSKSTSRPPFARPARHARVTPGAALLPLANISRTRWPRWPPRSNWPRVIRRTLARACRRLGQVSRRVAVDPTARCVGAERRGGAARARPP